MLNKLFGNGRKKVPVEPIFPAENFTIFKLNLEEGMAFATINTGYNHYPNKSLFPWCAQILLVIQDKNENGHPTNEEAALLNEIEEKIAEFLRQKHTVHMIGRVTRNGERDILYYIDKPKLDMEETKAFFDRINEIRNLNLTLENDPEWKLVGAFIK